MKNKNIQMKKSFLFFIAIFYCSFVFSQNQLLVQSNEKGMYLQHSVAAKENFYSIGRLFNIPPKEIAAYNELDMNNGLSLGQTIKIPLTAQNFSQASNKGRSIYYTVGEQEGLYRVSTKNGKVLMADLRKWNNLSSDQLSPGQKIIVGFLVSPEANTIVAANPVINEDKANPKIFEEPKQETVKQEISKPQPAEIKKPQAETVKPTVQATTATNDGKGGYFKSNYDQQSKNGSSKDQTVTSGIFKTSSGWQDAKYYALMDGVEPGTIVRIVNPTNNKAVYAKVLGEMAGIRQNQGLDVRISNAAASVLDISDTEKFIVKVNY